MKISLMYSVCKFGLFVFLVMMCRPVVGVSHPRLILLYLTLLVVRILQEGIGNMGMGNDLLDLGEILYESYMDFRKGVAAQQSGSRRDRGLGLKFGRDGLV